eukprot:366104-Chlamydomonas_euryale.AAC.18
MSGAYTCMYVYPTRARRSESGSESALSTVFSALLHGSYKRTLDSGSIISAPGSGRDTQTETNAVAAIDAPTHRRCAISVGGKVRATGTSRTA